MPKDLERQERYKHQPGRTSIKDSQGILICGEHNQGKITTVSKELITTGKKLSYDGHQSISVLLIGENLQNIAEEVAHLGVDKVLTAECSGLSEFHPERCVANVAAVCRQIKPSIVLFGQTDMGRDVAPRLAARLKTGVCLDCVDLKVDQETGALIQTKPVYGGNAMAVWASTNHQPHVVTMRPRAEKPAEPDFSKKAETVPVSVDIEDSKFKSQLLETMKEESKGKRLEEAKIIVAGGGGIGGSVGFDLVRELAQALGAAVGITRVPADENWMPKSLEIGQTGHIVGPDLYIAVGISGAPQHLAGCSGSKVIVAINKDPQARIFEESDFGIVGDYREVLPAFIGKLKDLLSS